MGSTEGNERERARDQGSSEKGGSARANSGVTLARNFFELSLKFRGFPRRERFLGCANSPLFFAEDSRRSPENRPDVLAR